MGQNIQQWTNKVCGRHPLKNLLFAILEYFVPND